MPMSNELAISFPAGEVEELPRRITKAMQKHGFEAFLCHVESELFAIIKPISLTFRYDQAAGEWLANFVEAKITTGGKSPRDALEGMRNVLAIVYDQWATNPAVDWWQFSAEHLPILDEHFARKVH
jgi:hypothetical protein